MKHLIRYGAFVSLILANAINAAAPLILPRSQSEDSARDLVGMTRYINLYDQEQLYGVWSFTLEYDQTFRPYQIAENLFGADLIDDTTPFIKITGSHVGDRDAQDWLADYFGLPTDFESKIMFKPQVRNVIFDIAFYIGLDEWLDGLYFRIHAPVVNTRWNLNFKEDVINAGVNGYDAGYFAPTAVPRSQLLNSFTEFASEGLVPQLGSSVIFNQLEKARISRKAKELTRLSDIQVAFGWNFLQGDDHHFGLNLRGAAPTGNRPEGIFLFEPIVGNGHFWELGLGVTGHFLLFVDECTPRTVGFYFDANLTHMFTSRQYRTFDLVDEPLSRYMLIDKMGTPVENLFINDMQGVAAGSVAPRAQFQDLYSPLANLSNFEVNVHVAAQFDATAMLDIQWCNWNFDIGYNYWAKTCEGIKPACLCSEPFNNNVTFAVKGDARMFGFVAADAVDLPAGVNPGDPIPLSATESTATIHSGTNRPIGVPVDPAQNRNPGIDGGEAQWAMVTTTNNTDQIVVFPGEDGGPDTQQRSTLNPILLIPTNLDLEAGEIKGASNRIFAHVSYNWDRCACEWTPFIGIGGFVELAHHPDAGNCAEPDFDQSCQSVAFSQWGVWVKGGVAF